MITPERRDNVQPIRSLPQNSLLHVICADVAKQKDWAGKKRDTEAWKRLFAENWCRDIGMSPGEVVPSLDGESVVILNISTRRLKKAQMADLITWIYAWCAHEGIKLQAPEYYEEYAACAKARG